MVSHYFPTGLIPFSCARATEPNHLRLVVSTIHMSDQEQEQPPAAGNEEVKTEEPNAPINIKVGQSRLRVCSVPSVAKLEGNR